MLVLSAGLMRSSANLDPMETVESETNFGQTLHQRKNKNNSFFVDTEIKQGEKQFFPTLKPNKEEDKFILNSCNQTRIQSDTSVKRKNNNPTSTRRWRIHPVFREKKEGTEPHRKEDIKVKLS